MSPTRTQPGAQAAGRSCVPKLLHLLLILLPRKPLINKRYSRYSRYSRLNNRDICSWSQSSAGTYKELARHSAEPAEPAVTLSFQWDKRSRRAAAHPDTCCAYHHRTIETAHSPAATFHDPESVEGCVIAPPHVGTITRKVITSLPPAPVPLQHPYERRTSTSLNPFRSNFPTRRWDHLHPCKAPTGRGFVSLMVHAPLMRWAT
jgi:hypothetical protein